MSCCDGFRPLDRPTLRCVVACGATWRDCGWSIRRGEDDETARDGPRRCDSTDLGRPYSQFTVSVKVVEAVMAVLTESVPFNVRVAVIGGVLGVMEEGLPDPPPQPVRPAPTTDKTVIAKISSGRVARLLVASDPQSSRPARTDIPGFL